MLKLFMLSFMCGEDHCPFEIWFVCKASCDAGEYEVLFFAFAFLVAWTDNSSQVGLETADVFVRCIEKLWPLFYTSSIPTEKSFYREVWESVWLLAGTDGGQTNLFLSFRKNMSMYESTPFSQALGFSE